MITFLRSAFAVSIMKDGMGGQYLAEAVICKQLPVNVKTLLLLERYIDKLQSDERILYKRIADGL